MNSRLNVFLPVLLFFSAISQSVFGLAQNSEEIPPRPEYPQYMYKLSDEEFGRLFFSEINLTLSEMKEVRNLVEKNDYSAALEGWCKLFCARMKKLSRSEEYPPGIGWASGQLNRPEPLLDAQTVVMSHSLKLDLGLPFAQKPFEPKPGVSPSTLVALEPINQPSMRWHKPDGFDLHAHLMWHPGAIIRFVERQGRRQNWTEEQQRHTLARWTGIWRDYANNSWRIAMYLRKNPEARQAALDYYALDEPVLAAADQWLGDIFWRQPLVVIWQGQNFIVQTHHAFANFPELFESSVEARSMAEIVYFLVVWDFQTAAENCGKGAANQRITNSMNLLDAVQMLPEFKRMEQIKPKVNIDIESIIGMRPDENVFPDLGLDGAGSESSYNYMFGSTLDYQRFLDLSERTGEHYSWKDFLQKRLASRIEFQRNIGTPTGHNLVLCKGSANRRKGDFAFSYVDENPPTGYTSIAFPYHGLFIMRDNWTRNALYMAVHCTRRGAGHESEDGNKFVMEAYGRQMLVSSPGEHGLFGSSWGQNTINIDSLGQSRRRLPRHGIYDSPAPGEWKTFDAADDVTTIYDSGYGVEEKKYRPWEKRLPALNTRHVRQIHFDKKAKIWIMVDTLLPEPDDKAEHTYTQVWNLAPEFPQGCVQIDSQKNAFYTQEKGKPNLFVQCIKIPYEEKSNSPDSAKTEEGIGMTLYYAFGWTKPENANSESALDSIPETAAGWANTGGGYNAAGVVPAPTVHVVWKGRGAQRIISVIAPSPDDKNPVKSVEYKEGILSIKTSETKLIQLPLSADQN